MCVWPAHNKARDSQKARMMSEEVVCRKHRLSSFQIIISGFAGVILLDALLSGRRISLMKTLSDFFGVTVDCLKVTSKIYPFCSGPLKLHGYYPRTLTHSTLLNRKCSIVYRQRRFCCPKCSYSFNEHNPFTKANDGLTHETKINILKDLKYPECTYTSVAERYHVSKASFDKQ